MSEVSINSDVRNFAKELNSEVPSWKETQEKLSPNQRITAENVFAMSVLKKSINVLENQRSWLQKRQGNLNEHNMLAGLLDAQVAPSLGNAAMQKFQDDWGLDADYLLHRVDEMKPDLEKERDKLFSNAENWNENDEKRAKKDVYKYFKSLPKEQQQLLTERTGLENKNKQRAKSTATWIRDMGASLGSYMAEEKVLLAAGAAGGVIDPIGKAADNIPSIEGVGIDHPYVMAGIVGASYLPYIHQVVKLGAKDWLLLKERDKSNAPSSKIFYDLLKTGTSNEKFLKGAHHGGFGLWYLFLESPYVLEAIATFYLKDQQLSSSASTMAAATLTAAVTTNWRSEATEMGRSEKFNLKLAKDVANVKYERNAERVKKMTKFVTRSLSHVKTKDK